MRVFVDALAARTGGGVTYLRSLLDATLAADHDVEIRLAVTPGENRFADLVRHERFGLVHVPSVVGRPALVRRLAFEQTRLSTVAEKEACDLILCPSEIAPAKSRLPVVVGYQNPNLYEVPVPHSRRREAARLSALLLAAKASARSAAATLFVSEPFRRVAAPSLGADPARQAVVEPGLLPVFRPVDDPPRDAPYILSVSDFYPYKNFPRLVDSFAMVAHDHPELRLRIAGRPTDPIEARATVERARRQGVVDRVDFLGPVPLERMPALYSGAELMVFPSLLESFGFPPLEAMACGVPVACSDASVMPEICGGGARYFNARDPLAMADAVSALLDDHADRRALVERGRLHASTKTWSEAGEAMAGVLRRAAA